MGGGEAAGESEDAGGGGTQGGKKRGTPLAGPTVSRKRSRASAGHISPRDAGLAEAVMVLPGFGSLDLLKRMRAQEKHVGMAPIPNSDNLGDKTRLNGYFPGNVVKGFADEVRASSPTCLYS